VSSSSQTPSAREALIYRITRHCSAETAEQMVAGHRAEILAEAIEAARGEYLEYATGTPEDEAYNQAVSDVVAALGALAEGGAR
jgi:hypothetical protein